MKVLSILIIIIVTQVALSYGAKCIYYGQPGETEEQTASGEKFNGQKLNAATTSHIPLGTVLQVTNQRNGRSVQIRVNDRIAGATSEDTIDLTYGAFGMIADHDDGLVPCSYSVL